MVVGDPDCPLFTLCFSLTRQEPSYTGQMCGRFAMRFTGPDRIRNLSLDESVLIKAELSSRYNIAPSQPIGALRHTRHQCLQLDSLRWGLVPHWSKGPGQRIILLRRTL